MLDQWLESHGPYREGLRSCPGRDPYLGFGPLVAALVVSVRLARARVDWRPRLNREGVVNAAAFLSSCKLINIDTVMKEVISLQSSVQNTVQCLSKVLQFY